MSDRVEIDTESRVPHVYEAIISEGGRVVSRLVNEDPGDLEGDINSAIERMNKRQQERNNFLEIRVCYTR